MAPEVRLDVTVRQGLFLSPEQRQAIELMVKPVMDVALWVQEEMNQNPFLEEVDVLEEPEKEPAELQDEDKEKDRKLEEDDGWMKNFHDGADLGYVSSRTVHDGDIQSIEHIKIEVPSLAEHLLWQYRLVAPPVLTPAGEYIIQSLDERGFFTSTLEEVSKQLSVSPESVQSALDLVHTLDPPGVGARNLQEALLIQVDHLEESSLDYVRPIIQYHLDDLVRKNYKKISGSLKIKVEKVMEAADLIGTLNPHPARDYGGTETRYVVPDLFIREVAGRLEVIVNENPMPRLGVNPRYVEFLRREGLSKEEKSYLKEKMNNARWILNTLHQRNLSLYLVARYIVDVQPDFFRGQFDKLRPLTLKQVADTLALSISTVSRLSNRKYADTPVGLFQLKYFFSNSVLTESGQSLSSRYVKQKIRMMIDSEDAAVPLSDVDILDRLNTEGIRIQRRTVAKYRESMSILPRRLRRTAAGPGPPDAAEPVETDGESFQGGTHAAQSDRT